MYNDNIFKRINLTLKLLLNLENVNTQISQSCSGMDGYLQSYYTNIYNASLIQIESQIDRYNHNIEKIKELNYEITAKINSWYTFVKDQREIKKLFFPVYFLINASRLKNSIESANQEIYNLTIENRLIKESIVNADHKIKQQAYQKIKGSADYKIYDQLVSIKSDLITELQYLLPTIPLDSPIELDINHLDLLIKNLQNI